VETGQITIILVIAALLLFRHYKSIKIGAGLLELTNLKNIVDSTVKDISDAKTEINKTKSGLESTIHSIEGQLSYLVGKTCRSIGKEENATREGCFIYSQTTCGNQVSFLMI
jgi:hypothetical protein